MAVEDETWNIDFDVAKSIRYHAYRRAFWDSIDNVSKVTTIVSGSAVLVSVVGKSQYYSILSSIVVAFISALDIALGFSIRARTHDGLYKSFCRLAFDIASTASPTEENVRQWRARRLDIETEEPSILDLLERRCAGEEAKARGREVRPAWKLKRWQIFVSQIWFLPAAYHDTPLETG